MTGPHDGDVKIPISRRLDVTPPLGHFGQCGIAFQTGFEKGQFLGADPERCQSAGHAFNGFTHFKQCLQILQGERDHACTQMRRTRDQSLGLQPENGFARRTPADTKALGNFNFADRRACGDFTHDNRLDRPVQNLIGQCHAFDGDNAHNDNCIQYTMKIKRGCLSPA